MNVDRSRGLALLPDDEPSLDQLGSTRFDYRLEDALRNQDRASRRAILWTLAVNEAFWQERVFWRDLPGFRFASCGFADPELETDAFGVFLYAEMPVKPGPPVSELEVAGVRFPVFHRFTIEVPHALPNVHPRLGTAACWATSKKPPLRGRTGFLTVKHVLQTQAQPLMLGSPIPLTTPNGQPQVGAVLDLGPDGIDAGLVEAPGWAPPVGGLAPLACPHFIAQWSDVSFQGSASIVRTKVVEVQLGRGSLHPSVPLRIFLAHPGQPGDSGALILDQQGQGVGLYMGGLANLAGFMEGYGQHLAQVVDVMNLDLWV